jgi:hypothetical protein
MWEEIFSGKYVWDGVKYKMPHPLNKKKGRKRKYT